MLALTHESTVGWRSCDVKVVTLMCMCSAEQGKYLVRTERFNHHYSVVHGRTEIRSWLSPAVFSKTWPTANFFLIAVFYYKAGMLYLSLWFIEDSSKFRNNFLKTSVLFLKMLPTSVELVSTRAKAGLESRRVPYLNFSHSKHTVFKETGGNCFFWVLLLSSKAKM